MEKKFLFGDRLKTLRKPKEGNSLSMDELSKIFKEKYDLSVNKSMISRWETGIAVPDNKHIVAYAKYFDIDMNYLIGLTNVKRNLSDITYSKDNAKDENLFEILEFLKNLDRERLKKIKEIIFSLKEADAQKLDAIIKILK
ncbi:XRE family transcriptional regulator [Fusobacterium necrophorum]|uniref:HTH cro/C1-type domain-containing protein n=1 Tax=Fusobacterium necrophorum BL TaxID=1441732 RepID=A0AB73BX18_9FUSO|nr:helix-turn-helix transcriptional regulator [Fusobacterium necrophorum]AYZ73443.1 XRE family transcriptional regulator [Fusobacterium necrophorum]AZW08560.1 XRE family transcriptional regulator [Fusobacterium necrophorum subsp. necrophorum]KDE63819.1 hypothetical protein FUSO3_04550 [Fusobacterium necrophorum BL]KDE72272.1 hypothetical protein FUSO7_08610 [Fusobacterium necrophorum BFTR-2]SDB40946.1 Helix-turn-helix domain-containing protein [Fusobacterium necrophorum]